MSQAKLIWSDLTDLEISDRDIYAKELTRRYKDEKNNWQEEKYNLHYYSWAACWRELMNRFPDAEYSFERFEREGKLYDVMYYPNQTASVHCTVRIDEIERDMWLPVMNYKNEAIVNPDARQISDAKMRCLVKTIAMFGLGLDLYEGKYDPDSADQEEKNKELNQENKEQ
ncbi:MAG: DUF1071 domain-containing protein [Betaproteobacteria bacterium]